MLPKKRIVKTTTLNEVTNVGEKTFPTKFFIDFMNASPSMYVKEPKPTYGSILLDIINSLKKLKENVR